MGDKNYHCNCLGECDWIASWRSEARILPLLRQKVTEILWESCMGYPSAIMREMESQVWVGNVTSIVGWKHLTDLDIGKILNVYKKALWKKVTPLPHMSSKAKYGTEPQERWTRINLPSPFPPTSTPATQTNKETVKRWSCSSIYP